MLHINNANFSRAIKLSNDTVFVCTKNDFFYLLKKWQRISQNPKIKKMKGDKFAKLLLKTGLKYNLLKKIDIANKNEFNDKESIFIFYDFGHIGTCKTKSADYFAENYFGLTFCAFCVIVKTFFLNNVKNPTMQQMVDISKIQVGSLMEELEAAKEYKEEFDFMRPFIIPCQLMRLYHKFKASSNLPSKKIAN